MKPDSIGRNAMTTTTLYKRKKMPDTVEPTQCTQASRMMTHLAVTAVLYSVSSALEAVEKLYSSQ